MYSMNICVNKKYQIACPFDVGFMNLNFFMWTHGEMSLLGKF